MGGGIDWFQLNNGVLKNFGPILKSQKRLRWVSKCRFLVILPPGTHLVKSYESQSRTSESKLKNESEIENAWAFM